MLAYRVLKTVTNEPKHLALFSLLSLGETGILTVLLKTFNLGTESNDRSTEIIPVEGNLATRGCHTYLKEGTLGTTLLCKYWLVTNSLEGKFDFSPYLALSQGVAWWHIVAQILFYYFWLDK